MKETSQKLATDAVRFFSNGGGRAYGNVVSISLLDGADGKLEAMLTENLLEVGKSLDLIEEGQIAPRECKKLNLDTGAVISKTNSAVGWVEESHKAMVAGASVGRVVSVQGVQVRIGAM